MPVALTQTPSQAVRVLEGADHLPGLLILDLDYTIWPMWCALHLLVFLCTMVAHMAAGAHNKACGGNELYVRMHVHLSNATSRAQHSFLLMPVV